MNRNFLKVIEFFFLFSPFFCFVCSFVYSWLCMLDIFVYFGMFVNDGVYSFAIEPLAIVVTLYYLSKAQYARAHKNHFGFPISEYRTDLLQLCVRMSFSSCSLVENALQDKWVFDTFTMRESSCLMPVFSSLQLHLPPLFRPFFFRMQSQRSWQIAVKICYSFETI